jgi:hypothetical protein
MGFSYLLKPPKAVTPDLQRTFLFFYPFGILYYIIIIKFISLLTMCVCLLLNYLFFMRELASFSFFLHFSSLYVLARSNLPLPFCTFVPSDFSWRFSQLGSHVYKPVTHFGSRTFIYFSTPCKGHRFTCRFGEYYVLLPIFITLTLLYLFILLCSFPLSLPDFYLATLSQNCAVLYPLGGCFIGFSLRFY